MVQSIIDIGNTAVKVAVFNDRKFVESYVITEVEEFDFDTLLTSSSIYLGSTKSEKKTDELLKKIPNSNIFRSYSEKKLGVNYAQYSFLTLGADRVANAEQAFADGNNGATMVIDMGTCITYDAVVKGNFLSYGISPGLNMRLSAMHAQTGKLPDLSFSEKDFLSITPNMKNTETSMTQSVVLGTVAEINDRINSFARQFSDGKIVLTGGDTERLKKHIKFSTFADPYWTLKGYNEILLRHI